MPAPKKLKVVALSEANKDAFMGSLIYRTGVDMPLLERLERAGKNRYEDIVPFMRENNLELAFHTPKHHCSFVEDTKTADDVICLLDVTKANTIDTSALVNAKEKISNESNIIVVVDRMQDVDWDFQAYDDLIGRIDAAFKQRSQDAQALRFIPISSANGDNLIDLSKKSPWYSEKSTASERKLLGQTVVEAIDS